jgi:hypothetical protein
VLLGVEARSDPFRRPGRNSIDILSSFDHGTMIMISFSPGWI